MNLVPVHKNRSQRVLYELGMFELGDAADIRRPVDVRRAGARLVGKFVAATVVGAALLTGASIYYAPELPPKKAPESPDEPYAKELGACNRLEEYTVLPGDGAYGIAEKHGVKPRDRGAVSEDILKQLDDRLLNPGDKVVVRIPAEEGACMDDVQVPYQQGDFPGGYGS